MVKDQTGISPKSKRSTKSKITKFFTHLAVNQMQEKYEFRQHSVRQSQGGTKKQSSFTMKLFINGMFQNPQTEAQLQQFQGNRKFLQIPIMGACIQGSKENIIVTPQPARRIKRRVSSIEDVLDPKLCRGGPTNRKSTKIRRNFVGHA